MLQQWFDQSVGDSRYNALQVTVQEQANAWRYLPGRLHAVACERRRLQPGCKLRMQNPYDSHSDYGTSDLNEKNVFSVAFTAASPYDRSHNKLVANVAGGWALNGIVQETSGQPYQANAGGDPLNIGCCLTERMNVSGGDTEAHTRKEWFNTSAFAPPTGYTYGNEKGGLCNVSQHFNDVDLTLSRTFST